MGVYTCVECGHVGGVSDAQQTTLCGGCVRSLVLLARRARASVVKSGVAHVTIQDGPIVLELTSGEAIETAYKILGLFGGLTLSHYGSGDSELLRIGRLAPGQVVPRV